MTSTMGANALNTTTQHVKRLTWALNHMNTPDFSVEESGNCYSTPLMSTVSSVQLHYLEGFYDCVKHDFLHAHLALLGTMQNLVFLDLSQIRQVLNWIQELFIPRNSSPQGVPEIVASINLREAANRPSRGKMGPRSFSLVWPRPLAACTNKRPYDLTVDDNSCVRDHELMDLNAYYDAAGLMPHQVDKKCRTV